MSTTVKGVTAAYQAAQDVADAGLDESLARARASQLGRDALVDVASEHIMILASRVLRERTLRAERDAQREARQVQAERFDLDRKAGLALGKYEHGSVDIETGAALRGCDCPDCEEARERDGASERQRLADISALVEKYAVALHIEWTPELLSSAFSIDGHLTTWGEASVDVHRKREEMFLVQGKASIESAARHRAAINTLEAAGVECLDDLVTEEVAVG